MASEISTTDLILEPTPSEVKRYQRQKLTAGIVAAILEFTILAVMAVDVGPWLGRELAGWLGGNDWLRLIATALVLAVVSEIATLPISFWSGFVLEHRYQLSTQSLGGWIWKRVKGYLVGGMLGLLLLSGLYGI